MIQALLTMGKPDIEGRKWADEERRIAIRNLVRAGPKQVGLILLLGFFGYLKSPDFEVLALKSA
ncbi:hypothetical protein [Desulfuromonas soudanensis]|uniref:hypothetical protein n=1 Tax=Desulfuromonas soudanensis TaxID=1603606 RepID=UPI0006AD3152|nr:hypothetical protein [Desulfuromonas soudanensis]